MVKQTIQIFCRIKPTKSKLSIYEINPVEDGANLSIVIPKEATEGYINNKREDFRFRFRHIFDQNAKQDDIFALVAQPVIDNVISGYNGTIFAYGQTGSGKTFTITGGPERYGDRGIIPRSLSYIFQQFGRNSDQSHTVHVSYLEIYNENGYDLLDPKHEAAKLEDLPKVILMEDEDQNMHLKNLSIHAAQNEEEALNLLFLGDTNRMIAETPMNQASTRSHCIFTIHVTSKEIGSATVRKAKLHLVDLAGSERVSKTNVNGLLLTEAKYINLSLHYLEQVIVALSEKHRSHIPYRNSMMTSVLRDSLGGNCMTTMIATCAIDKRNIEETISTCRFSQRVALIKNDAILNEELDPRLLINQLRSENLQLRNQILIQNGNEQFNEPLTPEFIAKLIEQVKVYLADTDTEATLNIGGDMRKIDQCYRAFKKLHLELQEQMKTASTISSKNSQPIYITHDISPYDSKEVKELKEIIKLRDNEISILVNMLKKEKKTEYRPFSESTTPGIENSFSSTDRAGNQLNKMSAGRQEAFDHFRRDNSLNQKLEEHKRILKQRYTEAKTLGEEINQCRNRINHMKGQYEQMHLRLSAQLTQDEIEKNHELNGLRTTMEREQVKYREYFNRLKNMKQEIEHIQHVIEKDRLQMLKDFDEWWEERSEEAEQQRQILEMNPSKTNGNLSRQTTASFQSESSSATNSAHKASQQWNVPLTGDKKTDDDILAFANARQRILSQAHKLHHQFLPVPTDDNLLTAQSAIHRRASRISIQTNNYDEETDLGSPLSHQISFKRLNNPIQARIYNFLERPCGISCFLYHFTVFVIVIGCLVYSSILTVYIEQSYSILFWIEFVLFILFLIEYIVRVWSSGCRNKYRGRHGRLLFMRKAMCIVDLCVIIGYAILICIGLANTQFSIQLVRYVRILQILRFLHVDRRLTSWRLLGSVIYDHRYELIATLYFCFIFLIVVAYLIWLVEKDESKPASEDMFHSFADTLWWAIITMATIGYGDKCPSTYIGKLITSCLCICGVAFWTLPSGIIGSGFALKVEQKKREKQFNRLVPAAASLIQNWWRLVACRRSDLPGTWRIYRIETKRGNKFSRHSGSAFAMNTDNNTPRTRNGQTGFYLSPNGLPLDKVSWRKVDKAEDIDVNHRIAIRMIRVIKYHVAKRKFRQAHKPYDFKDIMDENAQGNLKVMYTLADIQRRLDQTLGLPKAYPIILSDKEREQLTLNAKVQRLETKLSGLEKQTNRVISLLEELCQRSNGEETNVTMNRIPAVAEETTSGT